MTPPLETTWDHTTCMRPDNPQVTRCVPQAECL
jgi:hypothetical protein